LNTDTKLGPRKKNEGAGRLKKGAVKSGVLFDFPLQLSGTDMESFLERAVKVRPVLKATYGTDFIDAHIGGLQQIMAVLKPFFKQPLSRRRVEDGFEFLFES